MSKYAAVAILVLCFVCTFLTMIYQYGSRGWKYENNVPGGHGHTASHAAPAGHGAHETPAHPGEGHSTASPTPAATTATPVVAATPVAASPTP